MIFSRRLIRAARPIAESEVTSPSGPSRRGSTVLPFRLRLAESELISVPITLGILRPIDFFSSRMARMGSRRASRRAGP